MINVHYAKRIRNPFTTFFSKADTQSSFGRNFNITFTHWQENSSVWPYKALLQEYYIQIALYWIIWCWSVNYTYEVVEEIRLFQGFHPRLELSMKQKSTNVLKIIKWTNIIRSGLCLKTLYPSVVFTYNIFFFFCKVSLPLKFIV